MLFFFFNENRKQDIKIYWKNYISASQAPLYRYKLRMFQKDFLMMRVTPKRRNWKCKWGILLYKSYLFCGLPQRYTEVKSRSDWDIKKGLLAGIFSPNTQPPFEQFAVLGHTGGSRYGSGKIYEQRSHIHGRKFCKTGAMVHWPGRSFLLHTTKASQEKHHRKITRL